MPRPSKNVHVLALLRRELGLKQQDIASRVGVNVRTIRRIELGTQNLTWTMAERLGDSYGVDPVCLITNDMANGLKTHDGRPWTRRTRLVTRNRLMRWGDLELHARQA